jgi:cytochrome c peroxidase
VRILAGLTLVIVLCASAAVAALLQTPVPVADWFSNPVASFKLARGENPAPVQLVIPQPQPLSAMALLGKQIFFDASLSASGRLSCASCHSPDHHFGPAGDAAVMFGGPDLKSQGARAVPSLEYLATQPNFSIGPDPGGDDEAPVPLPQLAARGAAAKRVTKTAQDTSQSAANLVPLGGLFWDGRANTLQLQAMGPLLSPFEMDGGSISRIAAKLQAAPYASFMVQLFGPSIFATPNLAVSEALFAVARYQLEDPSFHPYNSKYDAWLQGHARLSAAEMRGYELFNDPAKGDCAACHLDQPTVDHQPPLFTDHQFEALGLPRNPQIVFNDNPKYYDLGICGPYRTDLAAQTQYCGMFLTPTLRNAATRQVFFHNGVYHDLQHVLDFYNFSVAQPQQIYPRGPNGQVEIFDDLPKQYRANIDRSDPPFDKRAGEKPPLSHAEEQDIIAFLKTLNDGYGQPPVTLASAGSTADP